MKDGGKAYLGGNGVYAVISSDGSVILTTENGDRTTNTFLLEPEVLQALVAFVLRARGAK